MHRSVRIESTKTLSLKPRITRTMNKIISTAALLTALISLPAQAVTVDGFRDLKFGMTKTEVISSKICPLVQYESGVSNDNLEVYGCEDFQFIGHTTTLGAVVINNKLVRVLIGVPPEKSQALTQSLLKKYEPTGNGSSPAEWMQIKTPPKDGATAYQNFAEDTITLTAYAHEDGKVNIELSYHVQDIDAQINALKNEPEISSDDI